VKPLGLRAKLSIFYAALFALVLSAFGAISYRTLAIRLDAAINQELEEMAAGLRGYLEFRDGEPALVYNAEEPEEANFVRTAGRYLQIYDLNRGRLLYQSADLEVLNLELSPDEVQSAVRNLGLDEVVSEQVRLRFHNTLIRPDAQHTYLMRLGASLAPEITALEEFRRILLLIVPGGVLLAALGGWFMARIALKPVDELRAAAHQISISRLDRRLPLRGTTDELDRLAETFNEVFVRLQEAVEQMRQFTASISHELRTPLTAMRGEAEVALLSDYSREEYRRVLASQLEEFERLNRLVNELLTLARAEAGEIHLARDPVDLAALVRSAADLLGPIATERKISMQVEAGGRVEVSGDPGWLERLVLNLLDNAIKFTDREGSVRLAVHSNGNEAVLEVRDSGSGISPEALPHIFERFYRGDTSRSRQVEGVGLGLALVRWIVDAHNGRIDVWSQPGVGSRFAVVLPLARAAATDANRRAISADTD
jgi:heavy metal sensor kinase